MNLNCALTFASTFFCISKVVHNNHTIFVLIPDPIESLPVSFNVLDQSLLDIESTSTELHGQCAAFCIDSQQQLNEIIVSVKFPYCIIYSVSNVKTFPGRAKGTERSARLVATRI